MLRIRLPLEAAPSTPGPEEWEEEEEEFLRRDESQDNLGVQATSSSFWAFRRLGLLAPPERDAELGAGRLEGATSLVSRRQLRLREHPSEVLLQWYLTLRLSDAMGTFLPSFHCPSQVSRFQRCQSASTVCDSKALPRSQNAARFTKGSGSISKPTTCFRDYQTLQFAQRYLGDVKALPGLQRASI